jgi:hypothetical protein
MTTPQACFFTDCEKVGVFQCSRCKTVKYCCHDHQKLDWRSHKETCKPTKALSEEAAGSPDMTSFPEARNIESNKSVSDEEKRNCRCMFCGDALLLGSEDEAILHMRVCPALQEQLASKDQFTVPSMVKEKYTKS